MKDFKIGDKYIYMSPFKNVLMEVTIDRVFENNIALVYDTLNRGCYVSTKDLLKIET